MMMILLCLISLPSNEMQQLLSTCQSYANYCTMDKNWIPFPLILNSQKSANGHFFLIHRKFK